MQITVSKSALIISFLIILFTANYGYCQDLIEYSVSITTEKSDLKFGDVDTYDKVFFEDGDYAVAVGAPMIPSRVVRVALSAGMKATGVELVNSSKVELSGEYNIVPMQPAGKISDSGTLQFVEPEPSYYTSSDIFPGINAELLGQADLAGQAFAIVRVFPLQYIAAQKSLTLYDNIELKITGEHGYICGDYMSPKYTAEEEKEVRSTVEGMVINPLNVRLESSSQLPFVSGVASGDYDYVIITPASYTGYYQVLLDWKNKKGVRATLVTTSWIYYTGGYSGDNQSKIRQFVQDAYSTWGARYFLLGGDTNLIPAHSRTIDGDAIPNDTYYADFDDDWVAEAHIGRVPGRSGSDMSNFVSKVITYEQDPPMTNYALNASLLGFDLDYYTEGEDCKTYIDSYYIPSSWTMTNVYDDHSGSHLSNANAAMNAGQNLVNHIDHCNEYYIGVGSYNHDTGWGTGNVDAFSNGDRQSIFYSLGCWANAYDYTECISEHMMNDTNGGSVALVGNSRYGWYYQGNTSGLSFAYDRAFFNSLFQQNQYRVGNCFSDHKNDAYTNDETMQYIFTELTLLGDPEMPMWTAQPAELVVSHPDELMLGQSQFVVHVEDTGGSSIASALVCLMKDDEVYLTAYTYSNGNATFNPEPTTLGDLEVTVTKQNFLPSETQAAVIDPLGEITGYIKNSDLHAIVGVEVSCSSPSLNDVSDTRGYYSLYGFEVGTYDITYSHPEYQDTTVEDVYVAEGAIVNLNVTLKPYTDDVGASIIFTPADTIMMDVPSTVVCEIFNNGTETNSFNVQFQAQALYSTMIEFTSSIAVNDMPGGTVDTIVFNDAFSPAMDTVYNIIVSTNLSGDMNPGNDAVSSTCRSVQGITVWYGNMDGSPITAYVGERFDVDVYASTSPDVYVADLHLCLGAMDEYVTGFHSHTDGTVYNQISEWALVEFFDPQSDPNPEGWSSQSFWGITRLSLLGIFEPFDDAPWLHTDVPTHIVTFVLEAADDSLLAGEAVNCLGYGLNQPQGPSNAGDSLGGLGYKLAEVFSPVLFRSPTGECDYMPGDVNGDKSVIGADVSYLVNYFRGTGNPPPDSCWNELDSDWLYSAADANGDCSVIGADVTYLVNYFRGLQTGLRWCIETPPMEIPVSVLDDPGQFDDNNSGTE